MEQRCGIDVERVTRLKQREEARFARQLLRCSVLRERARQTMSPGVPMSWMVSSSAHLPVFGDEGHGAWFTRVDGIRFLDTNIGDQSTFCGLELGSSRAS
jgi:4-aminobutyrate aminotransferase-like enzyme